MHANSRTVLDNAACSRRNLQQYVEGIGWASQSGYRHNVAAAHSTSLLETAN